MDGGKQQRPAPIGGGGGADNPAAVADDRPKLRQATRASAGPGQIGRAAGGYVSIIRYNHNITKGERS